MEPPALTRYGPPACTVGAALTVSVVVTRCDVPALSVTRKATVRTAGPVRFAAENVGAMPPPSTWNVAPS